MQFMVARALLRNSGHTGIPGPYTQELDAGIWTLDSGHLTLNATFWMLDPGLWALNAGYWTLDVGCYTLDAGPLALDHIVDCFRTKSEARNRILLD